MKSRTRPRTAKYQRLLRQEELILETTEALSVALADAGITRAELAKRLGKTKAFVTQLFGGGRNLTLRTIADVAGALDYTVEIKLSASSISMPKFVEGCYTAAGSTYTVITSYGGIAYNFGPSPQSELPLLTPDDSREDVAA